MADTESVTQFAEQRQRVFQQGGSLAEIAFSVICQVRQCPGESHAVVRLAGKCEAFIEVRPQARIVQRQMSLRQGSREADCPRPRGGRDIIGSVQESVEPLGLSTTGPR